MALLARKMLFLLIFGLLKSCAEAFVLEGSQTSYAQFRKWYSSPNASLEFEFMTSEPNGLLLYTDDGGYYDFLEVKLVDGGLRVRLNLGSGAQVVDLGRDLHKGFTWHQVAIARNLSQTVVRLDNSLEAVLPDANKFRPVHGKKPLSAEDSLEFGSNFSANSFVYVGGLPSFYSARLSSLALPSAVFEPRFRGSIRNIVYADDETGRPRRQEVMAYKGVRASTVDACDHHDPCKNGGICISTDVGPICECRYIDFDGPFCLESKEPPEATFTGNEFLTYDLVQLGGEPILSNRDEISLHFRTNRDDGLLFYTGDGEDSLSVSVKDGGVALSINLGNGRLDTGIKNKNVRFDDDIWHHVVITRVAQQQFLSRSQCHVTMTVDGTFTEKWTTSGTFSMLSSNKVFIGGSSQPYKLPGANTKTNFVGCMKKVELKADSIHLELLKMAKEGNRLITSSGFISYNCRPVDPIRPVAFTSEDSHVANYFMMQQGGVVSITKSSSYLVLPLWNNSLGGSLAFKFRTSEPVGLIMFNRGGTPGGGDFFAMELLDGYLYMHMDLGSGSLKLRASNKRLDDGSWHKVDIVRNRKKGNLQVDSERVDFETPGDADTLELISPLYIGGLDADMEAVFLPPVLWSAGFQQGFVGCLRDLIINGHSIDVAEYAKNQDSGSIRSSCHILPPKCEDKPCMHGGKCIEGWNRFICDCSSTSFTGPTCGRAAASIHFDGSQHVTFSNPGNGMSEAEILQFRFRTQQDQGLLVMTRDDTSADRLQVFLDGGKLYAQVYIGLTEKTIVVGEGLGDDLWHSAKLERRGMVITFGVDDDRPIIAELMGSETFLDYSRLHVGAVLPRDVMVPRVKNFIGYISQLRFNGVEYFDKMRSGLLNKDFSMTASFTHVDDVVFNDLTFRNEMTFLGLPQMKAYFDISVSFRFKTLKPNGLLMFNAGKGQDFIALELVNGHVHYVFNLGYGTISIKDNCPRYLNDNQWHTVTVGRPSKFKHTLLVDAHLAAATSRGENLHLDLDGILFLGGVRANMYEKLPQQIVSRLGYQGCIANLDVGGETSNPLKTALVPSEHVGEGCGESVAYHWGPKPGLIRYHFHDGSRPNTKIDLLSVGFITPLENTVLLRIDSQSSNDYLELEIVGGCLFAAYNLGTEDITIGDMNVRVNDGSYHVMKFSRTGANATLQIDDFPIQRKNPVGRQLLVFNTQNQIQLGGKWNPTLNRIDRPFIGVMAGLVFNGLRPLDLAAESSSATKIQGDVHLLDSIPFNYRERHPRLFDLSSPSSSYTNSKKSIYQMQKTNPSMLPEPGINDDLIVFGRAKCNTDDERYYDPKCFTYEGSGDELVTPVYTPPPRPKWPEREMPTEVPSSSTNNNNCDDDEDCRESGSGVFAEATTPPSIYYATPPATPHRVDLPPWNEDLSEHQIIVHHGPPTPPPYPTAITHQPQIVYENYDTKYNVYDDDIEPKDPPPGGGSAGGGFRVTEAATPGMVLVIGIIAGALIAAIIIVIIVMKMRTRSEGGYKVEETRTYQFQAPPTNTSSAAPPPLPAVAATPSVNGDDTGFETPSIAGISTLPGTKATVLPAGNGFYDKYVNNNRKTNSNGKPVREWYV